MHMSYIHDIILKDSKVFFVFHSLVSLSKECMTLLMMGRLLHGKLAQVSFYIKNLEVFPSRMKTNSLLCVNLHLSSEFKKCECRAARDCPKTGGHNFCVKLTRSQRTRSLDLCSMAALKCASYQFEILNEGVCESR